MFSFFKKKSKEEPNEENNFLEIENSVFNTEAPVSVNANNNNETPDYNAFVYQAPTYNVGTYKAARKERPPVVVDKNQLGYKEDDYNDNIPTVEIVKEEEPVKLMEEFTEVKPLETVPEVKHEKLESLIEESENISKNINYLL